MPILDLCLTSDLHNTSHRGEITAGGGRLTDLKNDTQSGRQADGQTELDKNRSLKTKRSKSAKWSSSIYQQGSVVALRCIISHLNVQRIKGVMRSGRD